MVEVGQLVVCRDMFCGSEVDASQHDVFLPAWSDVSLYGLLSVEVDGYVDYRSAFHDAVWWRVAPSSGEVYPDGRTSPDYLVAIYRELRQLLLARHRCYDALLQ